MARVVAEPVAIVGFQALHSVLHPAGWPRRHVLEPCYNASQSAAHGKLGARAASRKVRPMRKRDLLHALVGCFLAVTAVPSLAQDDEIRWLDSYREAIQEAKRT